MRYLCFALVLAGLPATVAAQQNSPTLPSLGLPLPRIGLQPSWEKPLTPSWERPQTPAWERNNPPPWEPGHVSQRDLDEQRHRRRQQPSVVYIPYAYPVAISQPQPIVVAQPASSGVSISERQRARIEEEIERIVEERIKSYRESLEPPPAPAPPPPPPSVEPAGSKTLYLIPGCYMGNVSPVDMKLPAGCDVSKLTTITP